MGYFVIPLSFILFHILCFLSVSTCWQFVVAETLQRVFYWWEAQLCVTLQYWLQNSFINKPSNTFGNNLTNLPKDLSC